MSGGFVFGSTGSELEYERSKFASLTSTCLNLYAKKSSDPSCKTTKSPETILREFERRYFHSFFLIFMINQVRKIATTNQITAKIRFLPTRMPTIFVSWRRL